MSDVVHSSETQRFEVTEDGDTAVLTYEREDGTVSFLHTVVPVALEGRGIGSQLAAAAVGWAVDEGLEVDAQCSFVRAWLERHPDAVRRAG